MGALSIKGVSMVDGLCLHGTYILDKAQQMEKKYVMSGNGMEMNGVAIVMSVLSESIECGGVAILHRVSAKVFLRM